MFTGIIEEIGEIVAVERIDDSMRLTVRGPIAVSDLKHGDSISVSGVCLTAIAFDNDTFTADVMAQTLAMSTHDNLMPGDKVNLERAAAVGSRLGGHIVQGHVDGTAELLEIRPHEQWRVLRFRLNPDIAPLVVNKGSITLDGVSLTVSTIGADTGGHWAEVSLIPETLVATTLGSRQPGEFVNLETDIVARHVARMLEFTGTELPSSIPSGFSPNGAST